MSYLFFGDRARTIEPDDALAGLLTLLDGIEVNSPAAYDALTDLFIEAAELAQGLTDALFEATGCDDCSPEADAAMDLALAAARILDRSWRGESGIDGSAFRDAVERLHALGLPRQVTAKSAEGYAFYALYPESFLEAGRQLGGDGPLQVIGIRSIGLGLAALVAAASGAKRPFSVRPVGHPFGRQLALSAGLEARLASAEGSFAVVDEGPGLSGSSFGAVLDHLEGCGVSRARIHLLPSHRGEPGPQAKPAALSRWRETQRHVVDFEKVVLRPPNPSRRLKNWFCDLTGAPHGPLRDISGGAWRALRYRDEAQWPASNIQAERRKYLLDGANGMWLLKFAGLGRYGQEKLRLAEALGASGFIPPVLAIRHGFLLERWITDAVSLDRCAIAEDEIVAQLGDYLGFRARHFSAPSTESGAALPALAEMFRHNTEVALGPEAGRAAVRTAAKAEELAGIARPVVTDNKMHRWEWLRREDGRLLKTDALDHAAAHDLVGCQDIAWDIAGAAVEFGLSDAAAEALADRVAQKSGYPVSRPLLRLMKPCYLAFQLGAAGMAMESLGGVPEECARLDREFERYRKLLSAELGMSAPTSSRSP